MELDRKGRRPWDRGVRRRFFAVLALAAALLAVVAAGCGGDEETAPRRPSRPRLSRPPPSRPPAEEPPAEEPPAAELSGSIEVDGSSTVGTTRPPPLPRSSRRRYSDVAVTVGISGTGGGFERFCVGETDISNASRPIKDEEPEAPTLRRERHRVHRAPGRGRRTHGGRQPRERLGDLPHGRAAQHHLGARGRGNGRRTGTRSTRASPTRSWSSEEPAPTRARSTTSPTRSTARRARAAPTTTPPRTTTSRSRRVAGETGGLGYFGFSYFEQNQDTPEGRRDRRRRRLRRAERGGSAGRHLHAARAAALHLREEGVAREARRLPAFVQYLPRQHRPDRRGGALHPARPTSSSPPQGRPPSTQPSRKSGKARVATTRHLRRGRAAGSPAARPPASLGRGRDQGRSWSSAPLVSVATTVGIVISLLEPAIEFFREINFIDFISGRPLGAAVLEPRISASCRSSRARLSVTIWASLVMHSVRPRRGDLPQRVRPPGRAEGAQARARGARRRSRPSSSATSRCSS